MRLMNALTKLLLNLLEPLLYKSKQQKTVFLTELKSLLHTLIREGVNNQEIENFIKSFPWLDELDEKTKEQVLANIQELVSSNDALNQALQFDITWDLVYSTTLNVQPAHLQQFQRHEEDVFKKKEVLLKNRIKSPVDNKLPTYDGNTFFLDSLPIADHSNSSCYSVFLTTDHGQVFDLPSGYNAYLKQGWIPPYDFIEAFIKETVARALNSQQAVSPLLTELISVVPHKQDSNGKFYVPGAIIKHDRVQYRGSGGYMSTLSINEKTQRKILENTELSEDGPYYYEESARVCGYLFGLRDHKNKPFAVVDGAGGECLVSKGTCHLAKFGPIVYKGINVSALFSEEQPYKDIAINVSENDKQRSMFTGADKYDGLQNNNDRVEKLEHKSTVDVLSTIVKPTKVIEVSERSIDEIPLQVELPVLGYEFMNLLNRIEAASLNAFVDSFSVPLIPAKIINSELKDSSQSLQNTLVFASQGHKELAITILSSLGIIEEQLLTQEDVKECAESIKEYINSYRQKKTVHALKSLTQTVFTLSRNLPKKAPNDYLHLNSSEAKSMSIEALWAFGHVGQDKAVKMANNMIQRMGGNRGSLNSSTREFTFKRSGLRQEPIEVSSILGLNTLDLAEVGNAHTLLAFESLSQRDHAVTVLCEQGIVNAQEIFTYGNDLYLSGKINLDRLFCEAIRQNREIDDAECLLEAFNLYKQLNDKENITETSTNYEANKCSLLAHVESSNFLSTANKSEALFDLLYLGYEEDSDLTLKMQECGNALTLNITFRSEENFNQKFAASCMENGLLLLKRFLLWQGFESEIRTDGAIKSISLIEISNQTFKEILAQNSTMSHLLYSWISQAIQWSNNALFNQETSASYGLSLFTMQPISPQKLVDSKIRYIVANQILPSAILSKNQAFDFTLMCLDMGADPNLGLYNAIISANFELLKLLLNRGGNIKEILKAKSFSAICVAINACRLPFNALPDHHFYRNAQHIITGLGEKSYLNNLSEILNYLCEQTEQESILVNEEGVVTVDNMVGIPLKDYICGVLFTKNDRANRKLNVWEREVKDGIKPRLLALYKELKSSTQVKEPNHHKNHENETQLHPSIPFFKSKVGSEINDGDSINKLDVKSCFPNTCDIN